MKYKIVLQQFEEGFTVSCPTLPGCSSQGETREEALANMREAIKDHLAWIDHTIRLADETEIEVTL